MAMPAGSGCYCRNVESSYRNCIIRMTGDSRVASSSSSNSPMDLTTYGRPLTFIWHLGLLLFGRSPGRYSIILILGSLSSIQAQPSSHFSVFLIQNTQNRDASAVQLKLDELSSQYNCPQQALTLVRFNRSSLTN
jgi:hypothetical protein